MPKTKTPAFPNVSLPTLSENDFEQAVGSPLSKFHHQCHAASLAIVRSGALGTARVARGACAGVGGQHSWVVVGDDCYAKDAVIVDPTLWSYVDGVEGVWVGTARDGLHTPAGSGTIWQWGRPDSPRDEIIEVAPPEGGWSKEALFFLELLGPLDLNGWRQLAHAPVGSWPAKEILAAMWQDERIGSWIQIDVIGMLTDLNPGGLYLP